MISEYFKVSDTDESVLVLNEILKVELKNGNVWSFNTRWDETTIAMKKQPDEQIVDNCFILPSASTVRKAKAIAVSVHSRYCSKRWIAIPHQTKNYGGPILGTVEIAHTGQPRVTALEEMSVE